MAEDIEKRVTNVEAATSQIARSLATQESDLYELKALTREQGRDIRELKQRYQAHEEYVTDRLNGFEEHVDERLNGFETRMDNFEGRVNERFSGVEARLDEQGQTLQGHSQMLRALAQGQQQIIELLTGKPPVND